MNTNKMNKGKVNNEKPSKEQRQKVNHDDEQSINKENNSSKKKLKSQTDEEQHICFRNNGAERVRKHRETKRNNENFDIEKHREMERKRSAKLRKLKKEERERKNDLIKEYRYKERLRKRKQRADIKHKKQAMIEESKRKHSRLYANKATGRKLKRKLRTEKEEKNKYLEFKVKMFKNANRKLKRKFDAINLQYNALENMSNHSSDGSNEVTPASSILESVSPCAKKRAIRLLKLNPSIRKSIKRKLRFDKVLVESGRKSTLKMKIEKFLLKDENSVVVPDIKKSKKGIRYRLMTLEDLHQKFVVDEQECSYPQFTRHVPGYIIKPKPEDWGTCLCKIC